MIFLETDLAIYKRLTGAPLDTQGRPILVAGVPDNTSAVKPPEAGGGYGPSYGVRIPAMKYGQDTAHGLTSYDQTASQMRSALSTDTYRQIPVFDQNVLGRKFEDTWPCVTFKWTDTEFDPSVYVYHDPFESNTGYSPVNILNRYSEVIDTGYSGFSSRPHPDSYLVKYAITVHAKTNIEFQLISDAVLKLFPARGALKVEFADGSIHPCDVLLKNIINFSPNEFTLRSHKGDSISLSSEEQRYFRQSFYYDIEAYIDNTVGYSIANTSLIYSRIIEICNIQDRLFHRIEMNALEPDPI